MTDNLFMASVNEAIQVSLREGKTLLIYLSDESSDSQQFGLQYITSNDHLRSKLNQFVLLKLIQGSQEYIFFNQVFHDLKLPSVYAIRNGAIVDCIYDETNDLTLESFNERVDRLLAPQLSPLLTGSPLPAATPQQSPNHSESTPQSETSLLEHPTATHTKKTHTLKEESAEIAALKYREQQTKLQRQAREERERILKLLALDKEERAKENLKRRLSKEQLETPEPKSIKPLHENIKYHEHDNDPEYTIQLKLFNGYALKKNFASNSTLSAVREFINENYPEYQSTPYYFFKPIDRITYSDMDELNKDLKELKLNRSLLIIKPSDHYGSSSLDLKKNGFQSLTNQTSSLGWFKSVIGSIFAPARPLVAVQGSTVPEDVVEPVSLVEADQSQYSTPVVRSASSSRASTPRPAISLSDSTNNFSLSVNTSALKSDDHKKDDRVVYNGNQLDLEDDKKKIVNKNKNNNGGGNFTTIGDDTSDSLN